MQFLVTVDHTPDLARVEAALQGVDPAALLDRDPATQALRISTWMTRDELTGALGAAGVPVDDDTLLQLPSECCGGCGG